MVENGVGIVVESGSVDVVGEESKGGESGSEALYEMKKVEVVEEELEELVQALVLEVVVQAEPARIIEPRL